MKKRLTKASLRKASQGSIRAKRSSQPQATRRSSIAATANRVAHCCAAPAIQAKLTLGPANDRYEQEADNVARQVMRQISSPMTGVPEAPVGEVAQRFGELEEDELQMKGDPGLEGGPIDAGIESSIQRARSGGRALDKSVRGSMEPAFGANFSGVKVHTDQRADSLNRSLQAKAFTTGQDIFFRQGEYRPGSSGGQQLLAHELTHVVQQNGNQVLD